MRKLYDTRVRVETEHLSFDMTRNKPAPVWIVWVDFYGRAMPFRPGHAFLAPPTKRQLRHAVQGIKRRMRGKLKEVPEW